MSSDMLTAFLWTITGSLDASITEQKNGRLTGPYLVKVFASENKIVKTFIYLIEVLERIFLWNTASFFSVTPPPDVRSDDEIEISILPAIKKEPDDSFSPGNFNLFDITELKKLAIL